jgi:hypothetical protein
MAERKKRVDTSIHAESKEKKKTTNRKKKKSPHNPQIKVAPEKIDVQPRKKEKQTHERP